MIVDIIAGIIVLISTFIAFIRGFIREVLTIAGVVGALAAAYAGGEMLEPYMLSWLGVDEKGIEAGTAEMPKLFDKIPYDMIAPVLSYGLIFIVVLIALSIASHFIAEMAKSIGLGPVDRTLGVLFGIARGVLLLGLFYLPVHMIFTTDAQKETIKRWFEGSQSHFYMEVTAQWLAELLPDTSKMDLDKTLEEGKEKLDKANSARSTLEKMDLLHKESAGEAGASPKEGQGPGYNENFRDQMDQLFEQEECQKPVAPESSDKETPAPVNE